MNPWPMVRADLRSMRALAASVVVLVALATAIGVGFGAQERALRAASARAADDFPLLIGAPGGASQLVLTAAYLQIEALPLIDGAALNRLAADPRVAGAAPIAFGDMVRGWPVIGTTAAFVTRWGRLAPSEGRIFAAEGEAVVGADVAISLGAGIVPSHGLRAGARPGEDGEDEAAHRHEGETYRVVGRVPRLGTPWDRAILVPIETVWETHGLGNGHAADGAALGPPFDAASVPGVPAIVVKPRAVADAYALRGAWRQGGTMAVFPAEVLVGIYRVMGDLHAVVRLAVLLDDVVVLLAIVLVAVLLVGLRRRRIAVLRALGAPRRFVLLVAWLGTFLPIALGAAAGLLLGWAAAILVGAEIAARTGLAVDAAPGWREVEFTLFLLAAGSVAAIVPALAAGTGDVADALRADP